MKTHRCSAGTECISVTEKRARSSVTEKRARVRATALQGVLADSVSRGQLFNRRGVSGSGAGGLGLAIGGGAASGYSLARSHGVSAVPTRHLSQCLHDVLRAHVAVAAGVIQWRIVSSAGARGQDSAADGLGGICRAARRNSVWLWLQSTPICQDLNVVPSRNQRMPGGPLHWRCWS